MKYTTATLALILVITISACKRTKTCPAFDDSTLNTWFPYEIGVTYKFISSDGRQETLVIEQENYSQPHEIENRLWGKKYYCNINGERKTATGSVVQGQIPLRLFHVVEIDYSNLIDVTFRTMDKPISLADNGEQLVLTGNGSGYSIENFDVWNTNGRDYRNITDITVQDDEAGKIGMDKIYIAKGAGIVGYRTYPEGREYWQE